MATRNRSYVFTLNNPQPSDEARLVEMKKKYLVFGREKAPTTGTPHLQGYVTFLESKTLSAAKKAIGPTAHLEIAKGTAKQASEYCKKDGDFMEIGTLPSSAGEQGQSEKERWAAAWDAAKSGDMESVDPDIRIRCYRTLKQIATDHIVVPADADGVTGVWLTGPAGCGKSRKAREDWPGSYLKLTNKWWDGYQGQEAVIIDDVDKSHACLGHHFKIWADRYAFNAETKGGMLCIRPKDIVVTSQYTIDDIWEDAETREALHRRFTTLNMGPPPPSHHPLFHPSKKFEE